MSGGARELASGRATYSSGKFRGGSKEEPIPQRIQSSTEIGGEGRCIIRRPGDIFSCVIEGGDEAQTDGRRCGHSILCLKRRHT